MGEPINALPINDHEPGIYLYFCAMRNIMLFVLLNTTLANAQYNSAFDEQQPVLSADGNELFFTVANHPLNVSGVRDKGDVWVSRKEDGRWQKPAPVPGLVNNAGYNAVLGFSEDGNNMFLYGHYTVQGDVAGSQGISVSTRNGGTWSLPRNETIPYFINKNIATGGSVSANKKIFVFSAEGRSHDSFGHEDIYVSFNHDGVWTEPLNLGKTINSSFQEMSPYFDSSNNVLYFSSNKPGGMGSFDVYQSQRLDDSWQRWSPAQPVGATVNSEGRELYFRLIPQGYQYTSTKNSDGYGDINEHRSNSPKPTDIIVSQNSITEATIPIKKNIEGDINPMTVTVSGRVTNARTGAGVVAKIILKPTDQEPIFSDVNGQFQLVCPSGLPYTIQASATGFLNYEEPLTAMNNGGAIDYAIQLQPVAVGVSVNLKHVLFRKSSAELLPESFDELNRVVEFLQQNPTVEIELTGHTDNAGNASLNKALSLDRVNRVKYYLVERGVDAKRVSGVGYGGKKPIASNKTDEGRQQNRRVEFKIIRK
jgi:OmpA-OmpF porin, OOP family